jgi:DNA-binding transcriptional LysR family regulator
LELRHLRYFTALAEELHFGRAAERLHISQPPLSQQIAQLEKQLGVRLLTRTSRSVELTDAGRLFLDEARRTLAQAEHAKHVAERAGRGDLGQLAVGLLAACGVIPRAVRRFIRRYPGVQLTLKVMSSAEQLAALAQGRLDVGFVHLPAGAEALAVEEVEGHVLVAALPSGHRLARQPSISWGALAGESFIGFPRASAPAAYDAIVSRLREAGFHPNVVHRTDSMLARLRLVGAGVGISLLPAFVTRLPHPGVVLRPLRPPRLRAAIGVAHDPARRSPALDRFLAVVREVASSAAR